MTASPKLWNDADALAAAIIKKTGGKVILATPLGLGKPNHLINAIYRRAVQDEGVSLKIFTALTLEIPAGKSELERRFLKPLSERLFAGYEELEYAKALRAGEMPSNVKVTEFFLNAGQWIGIDAVQQNYVSANYSDAFRYILADEVNVVAQMIAVDADTHNAYSLSCNPDITLDLLAARKSGGADFLFVGESNAHLPFMGGSAEIMASEVDHLLIGSCESSTLFNIPKRPVSIADYAAGFHAARLIPDGGTIQIGIGSFGDAIAHALIMRHTNNKKYREIMAQLAPDCKLPRFCDDAPFESGLYVASEMLVDTFLDLIEAGVVKRDVNGHAIDSGFFVGPNSLYQRLRDMPRKQRDRINMTSIQFVNDAHRDFETKNRDRSHARFINNGMKATLLGAVVSDGLENGQIISGVGGQYDFVRQAFALDNARSIIKVNAVRDGGDGAQSNIVWHYGHQTIPRHLRDIVITEYGVADLRGKSDADVIAAMLSIADRRFQADLSDQAKSSGKLPKSFRMSPDVGTNCPERIESVLCTARDQGVLPDYPFGTDFTEIEQLLLPALDRLKKASSSKVALARLALKGAMTGTPDDRTLMALSRMDLARPGNLKHKMYGYLLRGTLRPAQKERA